MKEALTVPAEYVAGLGLEVIKKKVNDKIDEKKLHDLLTEYIGRQQKYNEICTIAEEIDFQGLVEYIQNDLIEDAYRSIFALKSKERGFARGQVVDAAVAHSMTRTEEAKRRVARSIYSCIDIIKEFYRKGIPKQAYVLASEIVDAVRKDTEEVVAKAADEIVEKGKEISATAQRTEHKIDSLITSLSNGSMYSVANMIQDAGAGNLEQIENKLTKAFEMMSVEHRLYPDYGYELKNGRFVSVPKTKEAVLKYPPRYVFTGIVRAGDKFFNDPSVDLTDYAYRHQMTLTMNVRSVKKYLGEYEDPSQAEVDGLIGKSIIAKPPEFAPAIPCSVMVKDTVYFEYVMLRLQEVLDDGTLLIGNREQADSHIYFEFSTKLLQTDECVKENDMIGGGEANFTVRIHNATNKEYLNYAKFMKSLHEDKPLRIHVLNTEQDLFVGDINAFRYDTGFQSAEEQIDFLERICTIEDYFHLQMTLDGDISIDEYDTVIWISKLISQDEVKSKWSDLTCTGILDKRFRDKLIEMDAEIHMLSYVGNVAVKLFGAEFELRHMRTYKSAVMQDFERIKRKAEVLDDGDEIKISFKPGADNTVVDTLNVPDEVFHGDVK